MTHHTSSVQGNLAEILGVDKKTQTSFTDKAVAHLHEYYLSGVIEDASKYTEWFNQIRHAGQMDMVKIYINSEGGSLWTAIQFMRVLKETKATVVASVEGACMSAATIIFLMCDTFEISPHSIFMFHNYSGGTIGKGGEMIDQIKHERKWSEKLLSEIYQDFLSADEIKAMLNNKDLWMTSEEVVARLNKKASKNKKAAGKSIERS
jgi:ATP-dependent protease ClpP protease subunit